MPPTERQADPPVCWQVFQGSICHCLQKYCLNYSAALLYLDNLKLREDFGTYVKVQEANADAGETVLSQSCWNRAVHSHHAEGTRGHRHVNDARA